MDYSQDLRLTKIKGTLLNLNIFYDIMPTIKGIDEWQVVLEKKNNDPSHLDIVRLRIAPKKGVKKRELAEHIRNRITDSIEINPIIETNYTSDELFDLIGGQMKANRIVDNRPLEK